MKLFHSPTSPYSRKVLAVAIVAGIDQRIELLPGTTSTWPDDLVAQNPFCRVPCLITDEGVGLYDSPVICDYFDQMSGAGLIPADGERRWLVLKQQAIGDGMMDASIFRLGERRRPVETERTAAMERRAREIRNAIDVLEADVPSDELDVGTIAIACALGYLDFRFAGEDWRAGHPNLTAWYARISKRPALARVTSDKPA